MYEETIIDRHIVHKMDWDGKSYNSRLANSHTKLGKDYVTEIEGQFVNHHTYNNMILKRLHMSSYSLHFTLYSASAAE